MKSAIKRSIGRKSLTRVELETMLHEVEACINSRPLTFVGNDIDSSVPLTPSHFMLGRSSGSEPVRVDSCDPVVNTSDLSERQTCQSQLLDQFWSCWSTDYIRNLPQCCWSPGGVGVI